MVVTAEIVKAIIKEQSQVIGEPLAKQVAVNSGVLQFNSQKIDDITVNGTDSQQVFEKLISSYGNVFGAASIEVCINVIKKVPNFETHFTLSDNIRTQMTKGL